MQLDAVEARLAGAPRGLGEEPGQTSAAAPGCGAGACPRRARGSRSRAPRARGRSARSRRSRGRRRGGARARSDRRASRQRAVVEPERGWRAQWRRSTSQDSGRRIVRGSGRRSDREEVDDLDEEPRPAPAVLAHRVDEAPAGRARTDRRRCAAAARWRRRGCRSPRRRATPGCPSAKRRVPVEDLRRHEPPSLGGAPRHHGRHPRALARRSGSPMRIGENQRDPAAASRVGQRAGGSGWRTRGPDWLMSRRDARATWQGRRLRRSRSRTRPTASKRSRTPTSVIAG